MKSERIENWKEKNKNYEQTQNQIEIKNGHLCIINYVYCIVLNRTRETTTMKPPTKSLIGCSLVDSQVFSSFGLSRSSHKWRRFIVSHSSALRLLIAKRHPHSKSIWVLRDKVILAVSCSAAQIKFTKSFTRVLKKCPKKSILIQTHR